MAMHQVLAPLVVVRDGGGAFHHFYKDAVLPEYVKDEQLKRLTDDGLVGPLAAAEPEQEPLGDFPVDGDDAAQDAWMAKAKVVDITAFVQSNPDAKAKVRAAEERRGEKARSTLLASLGD